MKCVGERQQIREKNEWIKSAEKRVRHDNYIDEKLC